jgi:hypothetical protein
MAGRTGQWLDQIQLYCKTVGSDGNLGPIRGSNAAGGSGGAPMQALCPDNTIVAGFGMLTDAFDGFVSGLSLNCFRWNAESRNVVQNAQHTISFYGITVDGRIGDQSCPPSYVVKQLIVNANQYVSGAGVQCGPFQD